MRTALGSFQEIGTQFEVRILPGEAGESVRLRVREGAVEVVAAGAGGATQRVEGGEALRLHADGSVERSTVGLYGGPWQWIEASAPPFPLREAPLRVFLEWYCRETGLGLEFRADPAVLEETVSGDFTGMTVEETLATALLSSRLSYHRGGDTLVVEEASELPADP